MFIGWRVYYNSGEILDSSQGPWRDLPDDDVSHVLVFYDHVDSHGKNKRMIMSGSDWYFSDGDQVFGHNRDTIADNRRRYPGFVFLRGAWTTPDNHRSIHRKVVDDHRLP